MLHSAFQIDFLTNLCRFSKIVILMEMQRELFSGRTSGKRTVTILASIGEGEVFKVTDHCSADVSSRLLVLKYVSFAGQQNGKLPPGCFEMQLALVRKRYDALLKLYHENVVKYIDYGRKQEDITCGRNYWYTLQEFQSGKTFEHLY